MFILNNQILTTQLHQSPPNVEISFDIYFFNIKDTLQMYEPFEILLNILFNYLYFNAGPFSTVIWHMIIQVAFF